MCEKFLGRCSGHSSGHSRIFWKHVGASISWSSHRIRCPPNLACDANAMLMYWRKPFRSPANKMSVDLQISVGNHTEILVAVAMEVEHDTIPSYEARLVADGSIFIAIWLPPCKYKWNDVQNLQRDWSFNEVGIGLAICRGLHGLDRKPLGLWIGFNTINNWYIFQIET